MQQDIHDETWQWDDEKAVESSGAQAQQEMDALLMQITGTHSNAEADAVLLGRPRVGERREQTVQMQIRVPRSWRDNIDMMARKEQRSRSDYLRHLLSNFFTDQAIISQAKAR